MNYLLVAATVLEIKPLLDQWDLESPVVGATTYYENEENTFKILIGGIGMMTMSYHLGQVLNNEKFDLVVNVGIGGSFDTSLQLGQLVVVKSQCYGDLGAAGPGGFEDFMEMGMMSADEEPFESGKINCPHTGILKEYDLPEVDAVSVNTVTGKKSQISYITKKYHPQLEAMEGMAVHYACKLQEIPYLEIRAISNFVEVRNKATWKIKEAIETLNDFLMEWLKLDEHDQSLFGQ